MRSTDLRKALGFAIIVLGINAIWNGTGLPDHLEFVHGMILAAGAMLFFTEDKGA